MWFAALLMPLLALTALADKNPIDVANKDKEHRMVVGDHEFRFNQTPSLPHNISLLKNFGLPADYKWPDDTSMQSIRGLAEDLNLPCFWHDRSRIMRCNQFTVTFNDEDIEVSASFSQVVVRWFDMYEYGYMSTSMRWLDCDRMNVWQEIYDPFLPLKLLIHPGNVCEDTLNSDAFYDNLWIKYGSQYFDGPRDCQQVESTLTCIVDMEVR
ncbi:hypothetical protein F66182_1916 [Fusarium sp. NRRL 66182]|nr:hypothetical protein F66182_1916 [Fusarium sp. NRRL 66182]